MRHLLNINSIKKQLQNPRRFTIEIVPCLPSTNDYLKTVTITDPQIIQVCLAEEQTAGRGRLAKQWFSPAGKNIYLSLLFNSHKPLREHTDLSLLVAIAVIEALNAYGIAHKLQIKRPNDIYYAGKKLGGILIETRTTEHGLLPIVIGVGLNVNMLDVPVNAIDQDWTSLQHITGKIHDRNKIIGWLLQKIAAKLY